MPDNHREVFYGRQLAEPGPRCSKLDFLCAELTLNLLYTHQVFDRVSARHMGRYGLSKSTFNLLMLLRHGSPEGMQLHDLGELLLVSRANVTGLIDHLERDGWVKRVTDPQDRRARLASITPKAQALLDEFIPVHNRTLKRLFGGLSKEEKQTLGKLLKKMRSSVATYADEATSEEDTSVQANASAG